jgi:hypothetical protein
MPADPAYRLPAGKIPAIDVDACWGRSVWRTSFAATGLTTGLTASMTALRTVQCRLCSAQCADLRDCWQSQPWLFRDLERPSKRYVVCNFDCNSNCVRVFGASVRRSATRPKVVLTWDDHPKASQYRVQMLELGAWVTIADRVRGNCVHESSHGTWLRWGASRPLSPTLSLPPQA